MNDDLDIDIVSVAGSNGQVPLDDFEAVATGMGGGGGIGSAGGGGVELMPEASDDDDDDGGGEGVFGPSSGDDTGGESDGNDDDDDDVSMGSDGDDEDDDDEEEDRGRKRLKIGSDEGDDGGIEAIDDDDDNEIPTGGFASGFKESPAQNKYADMSPEEIQQMKLDVLYKMGVLHGAGYKSAREYSVDDSLQSLQIELQRLQTAEDMAYGLEMCRWGVVNGVSVLESLNEGLNLTPLKLKGWSATVHRRQHTLDPILLELYQTYFYKVHLGPVTKLSMALGLAAVNTHMANTVRANIESGGGGGGGDETGAGGGEGEGGGGRRRRGGMPGFANVIGNMMSNLRPPTRGGEDNMQRGGAQGNMQGPAPFL